MIENYRILSRTICWSEVNLLTNDCVEDERKIGERNRVSVLERTRKLENFNVLS